MEGRGGGPDGGKMVFPDDTTSGSEESVEAEDNRPLGKFGASLIVGGIEEDEIEEAGGGGEPSFDRGEENGKSIAEGGEILAKGCGGAGVVFDKKGGGGAAAEGFEAVGTGAGKKIEDAGLGDEGAEGGKNGGTDAVLGGAKAGQGRHEKATAAMETGGEAEKAATSARLTRGFFFPMT